MWGRDNEFGSWVYRKGCQGTAEIQGSSAIVSYTDIFSFIFEEDGW